MREQFFSAHILKYACVAAHRINLLIMSMTSIREIGRYCMDPAIFNGEALIFNEEAYFLGSFVLAPPPPV